MRLGSGSLRALVLALITASSCMGSAGQAEAGESYGIPNGETVFVDSVPNILARAKVRLAAFSFCREELNV
ncbi:hypothetical protein EHS39_34980 [Ensifer sp. MPMI2T]|nr:hypothetical protein EHS39_34980 [Ensifer sp. MPMI2T]